MVLNKMNSEHETCMICHCEMEGSLQLEGCEHSFHAECIIKWFRSDVSNGRCPMCNQVGPQYSNMFDRFAVMKHLRRVARQKNAPKRLVKLYKQLREAEKGHVAAKKKITEMRRQYKKEFSAYGKLRIQESKLYSKCLRIQRMMRTLPMPMYLALHT